LIKVTTDNFCLVTLTMLNSKVNLIVISSEARNLLNPQIAAKYY